MCDFGLKGAELGVAGFTTWLMVSPCQKENCVFGRLKTHVSHFLSLKSDDKA